MSVLSPGVVTLRDGREVTVRSAVPEDAEAVIRYLEIGQPEFTKYVVSEPDEFNITAEQERDWILAQEHATGAMVLIAEAAKEVVGLLNCSVQSRRRIAHVGQIGMTLRRAYWGSGLGSAMMTLLIEWAQAHPVLEMLQLSVYADNHRAIRLYRKCDFVEAGRLPGRTKFGPGEYKDDLIMCRRVDGGDES